MAKIRTDEERTRILDFVKGQMTPVYRPGFTRGGHDISHFQRGEAIANIIMNPVDPLFPADPLLVKIAVWCHEIHRTTYFNSQGFKKEEETTAWLIDVLSRAGLSKTEARAVMDAVAKHSRLNEDSDSPVLVYLKDIDHLDMGAIGILRIASHRWNLPPYQMSDFDGKPESTEEKDLGSLIHDLYRCLEWEDFLRTAGAKALGKKRFAFMRRFLEEVERELKELELIT